MAPPSKSRLDGEVTVRDLDRTKRAGGAQAEMAYMLQHWSVPLKAKYRSGMPLSQHGCGPDVSGKAHRNKLGATAKKLLKPQTQRVMRVTSSGKVRMEDQ